MRAVKRGRRGREPARDGALCGNWRNEERSPWERPLLSSGFAGREFRARCPQVHVVARDPGRPVVAGHSALPSTPAHAGRGTAVRAQSTAVDVPGSVPKARSCRPRLSGSRSGSRGSWPRAREDQSANRVSSSCSLPLSQARPPVDPQAYPGHWSRADEFLASGIGPGSGKNLLDLRNESTTIEAADRPGSVVGSGRVAGLRSVLARELARE